MGPCHTLYVANPEEYARHKDRLKLLLCPSCKPGERLFREAGKPLPRSGHLLHVLQLLRASAHLGAQTATLMKPARAFILR